MSDGLIRKADITYPTLRPGHSLRVAIFASHFPKGSPPLPILADTRFAPQHLLFDPAAPPGSISH
ncbi:hypothetical protein [Nocardia sp. NPDC052316]|uniref:hypothetical protein n=1 Tax=Nocardia sp. NPDC052316 TaxID=3364329 RepID=UPI0037CC8358